jgi:AraC-like DNA-binding protein
MKDFQKAKEYYNKSLAVSLPNSFEYETGLANSGLGSVYFEEGNYRQAEKLLKESIENFKKSESAIYLPGVYLKLSSTFEKTGGYDSSLYYADLGYQLSCSFQDIENILRAYKLYSDFFFNRGDYISAKKYQEKYAQLKDSIFNLEKHKQLAEFQEKYNLSEKEQELSRLNSKLNQLLRNQYSIAIVSITCLSLLIFIVFRLYKKYSYNRQLVAFLSGQNAEIEKSLSNYKQRETRLSENHGWNLPEGQLENILERVTGFLNETQLFLDINLTLPILSQKCGIPAHHISKAVNSKGEGNFSDYINAFRICEAKKRLFHIDFKLFTIEAIGRSVGFKSRTSFIAAFRKIENLTPSEYKNITISSQQTKTA